ncbi:MAG: Holliday junction resolvase-like protein [Candidatus Nanoarchaeia archaeon]|nr:Holliday junction resolvase-like protein [Candidatus Nanoarchaeia archaeon]
MIGWIIILIICVVLTYFIAKHLTEQRQWGEKKAELERDFIQKISNLEKQILEAENDKEKALGELKLKNAERLAELEKRYVELIKGFRKDAISRSRNTLLGKLWEQIVPYLPSFKHNPADMRFIGSPIDYIVFEGMDKKDIQKVIFLEVKTRGSKLNPQEKKLREAIEKKRVKWEEIRFDELTQTTIPDDEKMDKIVEDELQNLRKELNEDNKNNEEEIITSVKKTIKPFLCGVCGRPIKHKGNCMVCNIEAKRKMK